MSTTSPGEPGPATQRPDDLIPLGARLALAPQTGPTRAWPPEASTHDKILEHLANLESGKVPRADPFNALRLSLVLAVAHEALFSFEEWARRSTRAQLLKLARVPMNQVRALIPRVDELLDADLARRRFHSRLGKVISQKQREAHALAYRAQLSAASDRSVVTAVERLAEQLAEIEWDQGYGVASARLQELLDECGQVNRELDALAIHAIERTTGEEVGGRGKSPARRGRKPKKEVPPELKERIIHCFTKGSKNPDTVFGLVGAQDHGFTVEDVARTIRSYAKSQQPSRAGKARTKKR